jgi:hypothetical protein
MRLETEMAKDAVLRYLNGKYAVSAERVTT